MLKELCNRFLSLLSTAPAGLFITCWVIATGLIPYLYKSAVSIMSEISKILRIGRIVDAVVPDFIPALWVSIKIGSIPVKDRQIKSWRDIRYYITRKGWMVFNEGVRSESKCDHSNLEYSERKQALVNLRPNRHPVKELCETLTQHLHYSKGRLTGSQEMYCEQLKECLAAKDISLAWLGKCYKALDGLLFDRKLLRDWTELYIVPNFIQVDDQPAKLRTWAGCTSAGLGNDHLRWNKVRITRYVWRKHDFPTQMRFYIDVLAHEMIHVYLERYKCKSHDCYYHCPLEPWSGLLGHGPAFALIGEACHDFLESCIDLPHNVDDAMGIATDLNHDIRNSRSFWRRTTTDPGCNCGEHKGYNFYHSKQTEKVSSDLYTRFMDPDSVEYCAMEPDILDWRVQRVPVYPRDEGNLWIRRRGTNYETKRYSAPEGPRDPY